MKKAKHNVFTSIEAEMGDFVYEDTPAEILKQVLILGYIDIEIEASVTPEQPAVLNKAPEDNSPWFPGEIDGSVLIFNGTILPAACFTDQFNDRIDYLIFETFATNNSYPPDEAA